MDTSTLQGAGYNTFPSNFGVLNNYVSLYVACELPFGNYSKQIVFDWKTFFSYAVFFWVVKNTVNTCL